MGLPGPATDFLPLQLFQDRDDLHERPAQRRLCVHVHVQDGEAEPPLLGDPHAGVAVDDAAEGPVKVGNDNAVAGLDGKQDLGSHGTLKPGSCGTYSSIWEPTCQLHFWVHAVLERDVVAADLLLSQQGNLLLVGGRPAVTKHAHNWPRT